MKKRTSTILIGVLVVAGLILALPFSPLRNSFSLSVKTFADKALINLANIDNNKNKKIANSVSTSLQSAEFKVFYKNIVARTNTQNNNSNVSIVKSVKSITTGKSTRNSTINTTSNLSLISPTQSKTGNSVGSGTGGGQINNSLSNLKSGNSNISTGTNYIAMSTDLTTPATISSAKQLAGGGPPPTSGNPDVPILGSLPIGDGYCFLLLLSSAFIILKTRKTSWKLS
jgi:hypothetical protein